MKKERESDNIGRIPSDETGRRNSGVNAIGHLNDIKYHKHNFMNDYTFNAITGAYYTKDSQY